MASLVERQMQVLRYSSQWQAKAAEEAFGQRQKSFHKYTARSSCCTRAAWCKDTESEGSHGSSGNISQFLDRVQVSAKQLRYWRALLAVAFIMTGWSFATEDFVTFVKHVRPNFELLYNEQCKYCF